MTLFSMALPMAPESAAISAERSDVVRCLVSVSGSYSCPGGAGLTMIRSSEKPTLLCPASVFQCRAKYTLAASITGKLCLNNVSAATGSHAWLVREWRGNNTDHALCVRRYVDEMYSNSNIFVL
ncbi:hypothetical protein QQF64_021136 [Cirrhinus molitorella]|uniref:Secreted protein n=1 Tax=Cirrhinus molitorella TaxID=172907 RepID=A0ABR3LB55_9TELE